jgi:hypothetical protein
MLYLIYTTEEDANTRADQEGTLLKFAYWTQGRGTRWLTAPVPTLEGNYALDVTNYELSDVEKTETVPSYNPVPDEEE